MLQKIIYGLSCFYLLYDDSSFPYPVYTNRDGLTGFGMPWEIRFQSNYTVLRKGGNVGGYSALFSFVPELQLSKQIIVAKAMLSTPHAS